MSAMHDDVLETMNASLNAKLKRMKQLIPFDMTHEECIKLVAPSEHISILTTAAQYANVRASEEWMRLQVPAVIDGVNSPNVFLQMRTHAERTPPLIPRNPWWQPGQQGQKVVDWLTARFELGRRFGTASYVLHYLNAECENGQQLRFMLPAVLQLCKGGVNDRTDRWMVKHASYRPCRYAPALSPELRRALQDTSALLTSAMLIGEDVPDRVPAEVDIMEPAMPSFLLCGKHVERM